MHTYNRLPVALTRGEGASVWDTDGREFLDAMTGIAVCSLGHAHPAVADAICKQAGTLMHTSNWYRIPLQEQLADALCERTGLQSVFFGNSGAEANEAAIKLARLYGHGREVREPTIIVTEQSFHGRTMATLTATGSRKVQAGFEPLLKGFSRVPYGDLDAVRHVAANANNVVAVLVEPVLGEGGVVLPPEGYLAGLRGICDENDWLLMVDEIQTGMCRTGRWFAYQHEDIQPDVITVAKSLGNGFPIGACLAGGKAAEVLGPGKHGSTFGGNPLACAAALAVVDVMGREQLDQRATILGKNMLDGLRNGLQDVNGVVSVRGKGLMLGIELDRDCLPIMAAGLEQGLLLNVTAGNVVRLLPPLILTDDQADRIVTGTVAVVKAFLGAA
ncbi:MAG: aspartate aminotransferase family protein [Acidiferrobacteraceae bacterium]